MGAGRWLSTHGTQVLVSTQLLGSKRGTTLLNSSSPGLLLTLLRVVLGGGESMPYASGVHLSLHNGSKTPFSPKTLPQKCPNCTKYLDSSGSSALLWFLPRKRESLGTFLCRSLSHPITYLQLPVSNPVTYLPKPPTSYLPGTKTSLFSRVLKPPVNGKP